MLTPSSLELFSLWRCKHDAIFHEGNNLLVTYRIFWEIRVLGFIQRAKMQRMKGLRVQTVKHSENEKSQR